MHTSQIFVIYTNAIDIQICVTPLLPGVFAQSQSVYILLVYTPLCIIVLRKNPPPVFEPWFATVKGYHCATWTEETCSGGPRIFNMRGPYSVAYETGRAYKRRCHHPKIFHINGPHSVAAKKAGHAKGDAYIPGF